MKVRAAAQLRPTTARLSAGSAAGANAILGPAAASIATAPTKTYTLTTAVSGITSYTCHQRERARERERTAYSRTPSSSSILDLGKTSAGKAGGLDASHGHIFRKPANADEP